MKAYSSKAIANEFIRLAKDNEKQLTQMHIHKLIYFAHAAFLALYNKPLVEEKFQAWPFGPVLVSLYREFRDFGKNPISRFAEDGETKPQIDIDDTNALDVVRRIWEQFKGYKGWELSRFTHVEGSPWDANFEEGKSNTISNDDILSFYKDKVKIKDGQ